MQVAYALTQQSRTLTERIGGNGAVAVFNCYDCFIAVYASGIKQQARYAVGRCLMLWAAMLRSRVTVFGILNLTEELLLQGMTFGLSVKEIFRLFVGFGIYRTVFIKYLYALYAYGWHTKNQ